MNDQDKDLDALFVPYRDRLERVARKHEQEAETRLRRQRLALYMDLVMLTTCAAFTVLLFQADTYINVERLGLALIAYAVFSHRSTR